MTAWLAAFALTQCVEVPIYLALSLPRRPVAAAGASAFTHPLLWYVLPAVSGSIGLRGGWQMVAFGEVLVIALEAGWLHWMGGRRPWSSACVANLASAAVGLTLRSLVGWP